MKKLVTIAIAALAGHLLAGTYTWTGNANDGLWSNAGNWNYDGKAATSSPGGSPSDNVVIDGDFTVTYDAGTWGVGDFTPQSGVVVTISNGASLTQDGGNWADFKSGAKLVLDGGSYDGGSQTTFRLNDGCIVIRNDGSFTCMNGELSRGNNSTLTIESGTMVLGGNYAILSADTLGKGSISSSGELSLRTSVTLNGFSLSCKTLVPQNTPTITLKEGSLSTRRTDGSDNGGFYGACTVDIIVGKSSSFSALVWNDRTAYADTFGTSRFKYNGNSLKESEFNEIFTTTTSVDGDWTRYTISTEEVAGTPAIASHSASYSEYTLAFAAELESSSAADTVLTLYYDTSDHEHNTSFGWPNVVPLVLDSSDGLFKATVTVPDEALYYYLIGASSESAGQTVWVADTVIAADMPTDSNVWLGNTSDMTVASNWSKNVVPGADDIVEVNRFFSKGDHIDWDVSAVPAVAGWRQDYVTTVIFNSTAETPFTIAGDVNLSAGSWTHVGPADEPIEMVNVSVGGALTIGAGARIVTGTGENTDEYDGRPRGYTRGHGPGYLRTAGGSYAGEGGHITNTTGFVSYGSILDPLSYGSGGWGDNSFYAGGGIIKLTIGGALTVDGTVATRGFGYALNGTIAETGEPTAGGAGSGGSISITAASLSGAGTIDANGGNNGLYGPGSGGRVKVALTGNNATFDSFSGTIEAVGGWMESLESPTIFDVSPAAGGTVCLQTGNSNPIVKVYNVFRIAGSDSNWRVATGEAIPSATHLPAMQDGDSLAVLKHTEWELSGQGAIRLTRDVQIASLSLATDNGTQMIYTDGHNLKTAALYINGARLRGTFTKDNAAWVDGEGSVTVGGSGFAVFVR